MSHHNRAKPGMWMSHTCVNITFLPLGKLILRGGVAMRLFPTSTPCMMKIDVAPMLAKAWLVAILIAFKYWGNGSPLKWRAIAAINGHVCWILAKCVTFNVTISNLMVGSREHEEAEIKLLHIFSNNIYSSPARQVRCPDGRTVLCIHQKPRFSWL